MDWNAADKEGRKDRATVVEVVRKKEENRGYKNKS